MYVVKNPRERKKNMFNYDKLWKLLIDRKMKKKDLVHGAKITPTAVANMGKGLPVSLSVIGKICDFLKCGISDVVEYEARDDI